jgi:hypothetical protein
MKLIQIFIMMFFCLQVCQAQIAVKEPEKLSELPKPTGFKLYFIITDNGDTLPIVTLHPVSISENRTFANKREERKWSRLKRDVAKVYPYSKIAGKKLKTYNDMMVGKPESEQKKLLKRAESELKNEFEGDIRNMTLNQGRILIKLIDRETGNSSYGLVKDLRGSFQAFFWQSLARVFSTNLKETYNPYTNPEDKMIEDIIGSIEDGSFVN